MPVATRKTKPIVDQRQIHLITRALSDARRFQIFQRIASCRGCTPCANLRAYLTITAPTLSHHLRELETSGLIDIVRDGRFTNLTLRRDVWQAYLDALRSI